MKTIFQEKQTDIKAPPLEFSNVKNEQGKDREDIFQEKKLLFILFQTTSEIK